MRNSKTVLALVCVSASFVAACGGLLSKGDAGAARYFTLGRGAEATGAMVAEAAVAAEGRMELRLGRVTGATHLEDRLVFRASANEIGYHRELRWTAPPELYLKRMLTWELYEQRGLGHSVGGDGPALDVVLTALDELLAPVHVARVRVVATLHTEQMVLWEETVTVDRPIIVAEGGDAGSATVDALGEALQGAVEAVAERAVRELGAKR